MYGEKNLYRVILILVIAVFFNVCLFISTGLGGEKYVLTLQDAVNIALNRSYEVQSFKMDVEKSEHDYNFFKANFRPYANINFQTPNFSENVVDLSLPGQLPVYNSRGTFRYQTSLNFNYVIPTNGKFTLSSTIYHTANEVYKDTTIRENPQNPPVKTKYKTTNKQAYTNLRLSFSQPIFTDNTLKENLKSAELGYERSLKKFNRGERDIIYDVTSAFYSLYRATRQLEIYQERMENSKSSYEMAQQKFEAGIIAEVDAMQLHVDYASSEADILSQEGRLEREKDLFKQLIGLELEDDIEVVPDMSYTYFEIDEDYAINYALENRAEIREREIAIEMSRINMRRVRRGREFKGNVNAYYDFTGVSSLTQGDPAELFSSSLTDFRKRPQNIGVVLSFEYPILDWGRNSAQVQSAQVSIEEAELELENYKTTMIRDIRNVTRNVMESRSRLEILKESQDIAEKMYEMSKERFEMGHITSQELAQQQERLTSAQSNFLNAFITYKLNTADLKRKTLWDFEKNESYMKEGYLE